MGSTPELLLYTKKTRTFPPPSTRRMTHQTEALSTFWRRHTNDAASSTDHSGCCQGHLRYDAFSSCHHDYHHLLIVFSSMIFLVVAVDNSHFRPWTSPT